MMAGLAKKFVVRQQDLTFRYSRSPGPGGQNVNKLNTKVTVLFDAAGCGRLTAAQKSRILKKLAARATKDGIIRVVSHRYRTQKDNRRAAVRRLNELLQQALARQPIRKKTKTPHWARQERLEKKKRRSRLKQQRSALTDY